MILARKITPFTRWLTIALFLAQFGCAHRKPAAPESDLIPVTGNVFSSPPPASEFTKPCGEAAHGAVRMGYQQPTSPGGLPCLTATQVCTNGEWIGPPLFPHCEVLPH